MNLRDLKFSLSASLEGQSRGETSRVNRSPLLRQPVSFRPISEVNGCSVIESRNCVAIISRVWLHTQTHTHVAIGVLIVVFFKVAVSQSLCMVLPSLVFYFYSFVCFFLFHPLHPHDIPEAWHAHDDTCTKFTAGETIIILLLRLIDSLTRPIKERSPIDGPPPISPRRRRPALPPAIVLAKRVRDNPP